MEVVNVEKTKKIVLDFRKIIGKTSEEIVTLMRTYQWYPESNNIEYMENVAQRVFNVYETWIRVDTPKKFLTDLAQLNIISIIKKRS